MHSRLTGLFVAAAGLVGSLDAQSVVPVDSAPTVRTSTFRMDPTAVLPDTVLLYFSIGGNYSYGRNDNALFRSDNSITARTHRRLVTRIGSEYGVGLATNDDGDRYMDRRWWRLQANMDLDPENRLSPFVLSSVESSYELRITRRTTVGAGAKLTILRHAPPPDARKTPVERTLPGQGNRVDVSMALTSEQNLLPPIDRSALPSEALSRRVTRLSGRFRWTQRLGRRWWSDQTTWFKPELLALHRYNAELYTSLNYALTRRTQFTIRSRHVYEGSASSRGAKNNRTGSLDISVNVNLGAKPR